MNIKPFLKRTFHAIVHRKVMFTIEKDGLFLNKYDHYYKWDEIKSIVGYISWIATSDLIKIEIVFNDGRKIVFDDGHYNINHLLDEVFPNKLSNINKNWYSEVTTLEGNEKPCIIYWKSRSQ